MELEEHKIIEQVIKKKKERGMSKGETESQEQIEIRGEHLPKTIIDVKIEKKRLSSISKDTTSEHLKRESLERCPQTKLSLKPLETKRDDTSSDVKSEVIELSLAPAKLIIRRVDTSTDSGVNKTKPVIIKSIQLKPPSLQLRPITQGREVRREVKQVKIESTPRPPKELKLKPMDVTVVPVKYVEGIAESKEGETLEGVDFIESLLGKGSRRILSGKPLCIIVERHRDDYEWLIAAVCREIYREKKGGYPQPIPVKSVEDIEFKFRADISNQIIIVERAKYSETLRKTLLKFPFSDLGFLILVSEKPEELEEEILRSAPTVEEYLVRIEPVRLDYDAKVRILELVAGSRLIKGTTFGKDFIKATERFNSSLEEYLDFSKVPDELKLRWHKLLAKSPESLEEASKEHSAMKAFTWIYLWKKHKVVPELESEDGVDVRLNDECYEIETFYKRDPIGVLTEKVEKLKGKKISFVLRNISMLIHLKDLISFVNTQRRSGINVKIFGIDFNKKELTPIEEFAKMEEIKKIKK